MATHDVHNPETLSNNKLNNVEVNVSEIGPDSPGHEIDRLTMQSPAPRENPLTVRKYPFLHGRPRASSPTGSVRSSFSSRRHVSRHSHWSSGFVRSHRSEVSKQLTIEAESEFLALMELMAGISRRSASLKEVWTKIISEREAHALEMDRMYEQFEDLTETIDRYEKEKHSHNHEHEERKGEIAKLRLELTAALSDATGFKQKLADRDRELGDARHEVAEFKDNFKYLKEEHEQTKKTLEETQLKLVASQEACHHAEEDAKKHHGELRSLKQKYIEMEASRAEFARKYEAAHKEITSLKQVNTVLKQEKHEWMHEKGELEEGVRRSNHRYDELKIKNKDLQDLYEKKKHDVHELTESVSKFKYEREELTHKVQELKRQLEEEHSRWEDAEDQCGKWKLKWEHSQREITSIREELRVVESEKIELQDTLTKKSEEVRRLVVEKERLEEDYHSKCGEVDEHRRQIITLQESIRRTESTLKEKSELIHTLHERIERVESDRDAARGKCADLEIEISQLQKTTVSIKVDIETITKERDSIRERLHELEAQYEEVCESVTEYHEGTSGFEYEITSLRAMLREAREQKEKAITMRNAADHERDESIARYEAKCREMEKLEESFAQQYHSHGGRSSGSTRTVTRRYHHGSSGTYVEGGEEDRSVMSGGAAEAS